MHEVCALSALSQLPNLSLLSICRLPFWRDEDDMAMTSMTDVRSAVDEAIPLDYGPWLRASPQCRDFVGRLLQVGNPPTSRSAHAMALGVRLCTQGVAGWLHVLCIQKSQPLLSHSCTSRTERFLCIRR